ncbi:MAG: hypothetical protein M1549_03300 [Candidatus Dependentiae bacterium]|nr:hypothetical protein [Candidatus Dependentiae bacterium]
MKNTVFTLTLVSFLVMASCWASESPRLAVHIQTAQFHICCAEQDREIAPSVLSQCEDRLAALTRDFARPCDATFTLFMYPDIDTFHEAMSWPDGPAWYTSSWNLEKYQYFFISPNRPGPYHSSQNIRKQIDLAITKIFMANTCRGGYDALPHWFRHGVACLHADHTSPSAETRKALAARAVEDPRHLPTFDELCAWDINDDRRVLKDLERTKFFVASSYTLAEFIHEKWGWGTLLTLFDNYASLEKTLGMNRETFYKEWISFVVKKYGTKTGPLSVRPQ